jgi:hypothetical protein
LIKGTTLRAGEENGKKRGGRAGSKEETSEGIK